MAIPKPRLRMVRPEILSGATYKFKSPLMEEHLYVTINNASIDEQIRPVEIFINTKDVTHFEWLGAVTRLLSAQLQQAGAFPAFVIDELRESYDPKGGYFIPGTQKRVGGVVAHLGEVLYLHCVGLGLMK